ncbi:MAG: PASTA domain-containing protein [Candidatus Hydrogenedentes bacterium]|nr:PASTA domain-containing protein [Candidatus Hydrogenedentota bacterium]
MKTSCATIREWFQPYLCVGFLLISMTTYAQSVVVPDVVSLLLADAEDVLTSAGLSPALENVGCSDDYPLTTILSQDPPAGTEVAPGETIFLIMVSGPCSVAVPDVQGMDFDLAEIALFEVGLVRGELTVECSDTVPSAHIIRQDPAPGTLVDAGTAVNVWVSNGTCYRVPDVIGNTLEEAETRITSVGLMTGAVLPVCDDRYPPGVIVGQSPEAPTAVEPGSFVMLEISVACLPVPDTRGMSRVNALAAIRSAGFSVGVVWQECSNTVATGNVISQWPEAGVSHVPGDQVDLVISSGPCPVSVPAVEGMAQNAAQSAIIGVGLAVGLVIQQCSNTVPAGRIIFQRPTAGTQAAWGSSVDLVVSTGACERYVNVPSLAGMTESAAALMVTASDLYLNRVSRQCNDTVPAGRVISQSPGAGSLVVPGASVDLVVSSGVCPVVPDVRGLPRDAAMNSLEAAGLVTGIMAQQCDDTVPAGTVISQSPVSGTSVTAGAAVNLVLSTGPCNATVPDLAGLDETSAQDTIGGAGLVVGDVTRQCSDTVGEGQVISQSPAAGNPVSLGMPVNLVISAGNCLIAPGVTGQSLEDAQAALQSAGFSIGNVGQLCNDAIPEGDVISQSPLTGTSVAAGAVFDLVISAGPCPVTVPSVEGRSESVAEAILTVGRLTVGNVTMACSDTVPVGSVVSQTPTGGSQVVPGTAVNLVLASGPCTVTMPDVSGQTESAAREALAAAGMMVRTVYECDGVPEDEVISQSPAGGVLATVGTEVTLVVSSGPCPPSTRLVPDVTDQNPLAAVSLLVSSGLQAGSVTYACSDTVSSGNVISQDPAAGTEVSVGASVTLTISSGPCVTNNPVVVPDVTGQNQLAAAGAVIAAGLNLGTVTTQCSDTVAPGSVISQNPTSGREVNPGTAVSLVVSSGPCAGHVPETVIVPEVTGLNEYEAREVLRQAGLEVTASLYVFSDTANPGVVLAQAPLSGVEVSYGTTVTLRVSRGLNPKPPSDGEILESLYDRFNQLDKDKDQRLSLEEAVGPAGLPGMSVDAFNQIDLNHDGYLTQYELEQYLQVGGAFSCLRRMAVKDIVARGLGDLLLAGLGLVLLAVVRTGRQGS